MLEVSYPFRVDYPLYTILFKYYDYEHMRTVHPKTLGEYRVVEVLEDGHDILYDHLWPTTRGGSRLVSRVRHRLSGFASSALGAQPGSDWKMGGRSWDREPAGSKLWIYRTRTYN